MQLIKIEALNAGQNSSRKWRGTLKDYFDQQSDKELNQKLKQFHPTDWLSYKTFWSPVGESFNTWAVWLYRICKIKSNRIKNALAKYILRKLQEIHAQQ